MHGPPQWPAFSAPASGQVPQTLQPCSQPTADCLSWPTAWPKALLAMLALLLELGRLRAAGLHGGALLRPGGD